MGNRLLTLAAWGCGLAAPVTAGAQELLNVIVAEPNATAGKTIAAFGYDPSRDEMFVTSFGASGDFTNASLRRVTNVNGGAAGQTSAGVLSEGQLQLYYRDGNPDRGVSTPLQSALLLNPKAVGASPAYSFAIIADNGFTRLPSSTTTDPAVTKRFYSFNRQNPPAGGDGRDIFTTRVTLQDMQTAIGSTNLSSNQGRQFAWSGDGQSYYFEDSSTVFGGIWKAPAAGGAPTRILADSSLGVSEPAVVAGAGGVDRIYVAGSTNSGNAGGVDVVTHNGSTTSRQAAISVAAIRDFLELPATHAGISPASLSADADGNVYFNNTTSNPERRGLFRLDPQGRLAKVVGYTERKAAFGTTASPNPNSNMLRQQPRTVTYTGPDGPFPLTQILYVENTINSVAAVNAFKTGDFNRDNTLDAEDVNQFKPVLTVRGVSQTANVPNLKFDGNGNDVVDWKDVKVFQPFFDFGDGDVNINGIVDFNDFQTIQNNFGLTGRTFIQGDLDGDDDVDFSDFQILQNSFGYRSSVLGVGQQAAAFDQAAWDEFVANVPEPSSAAAAGLLAAGLLLRRRRQSRGAGGA